MNDPGRCLVHVEVSIYPTEKFEEEANNASGLLFYRNASFRSVLLQKNLRAEVVIGTAQTGVYAAAESLEKLLLYRQSET